MIGGKVMKKLLIFGSSGLVGRAIIKECSKNYQIYGTYQTTNPPLPIENQIKFNINEISKLKEIITTIQPDYIISSLRGDFSLQLQFHQELAKLIKHTDTKLYYFSTANVFDGDYSKHHNELDTPLAQSEYGKFKIKCEQLLKNTLIERAIIIRIPQVWGLNSPRIKDIQEKLSANSPISGISNLSCNHITDVALAKQLHHIIQQNIEGIFHLGSTDMMTHADFIQKILLDRDIVTIEVFNQEDQLYHFGLTSIRSEIPTNLSITNKEIIEYLRS